MSETRVRDIEIVEMDKHNIYEVSWKNREDAYAETNQKEEFDNYIDAYLQYEHLQKLDIKATLRVILLPLPRIIGD